MSYRCPSWAIFLVSLAACSPAPRASSNTAATVEPVAGKSELQLRLAYLKDRIERERATAHVPGMAVAVVEGDHIVFAEGFGTVDIESNKPVTPDTLFMVGSTTKAFTATVLGMLVDDGKLGWDDPLSKHVPLKLKTDGDREATVRDALSHRTGFPRMTMLLVSKLPIAQTYARMAKAKPSAKLGKQWQYNNMMYLTAGDVSARIAGKSWGQLVKERLFDPLAMSSATVFMSDAKATGKLSSGYAWNKHSGKYNVEAARDIGAAAPAGAITANVHDMAKWIRFNMSGGRVGGKRLISKAQLEQIHTAQILMSGSNAGYAFGWMVRKWQGHEFLTHGGSIDGFNTSVGFLPKRRVGFVVLTNTSNNSMAQTTGTMVFEAMLTDAYKEKKTSGEDFAPYLGQYVADFAPFDKGVFTVKEQNGQLAVDVPGQTLYVLKAPDKKGRRYFVATDQIFVTFALTDGRATALELTQGGLKMEIWRKGLEPTSDIGEHDVKSLLGEYKLTKKEDRTVTVLVHRGRLALELARQPRFVLRPPEHENGKKWVFRGSDEFWVTFEKDGELVMTRPGSTLRAVRTAKPKEKKTVTLADVLRRRRHAKRRKAFAKMGDVVSAGTMSLVNSGVEGKVIWTWSGAHQWREDIAFDIAINITTVSGKTGGWVAPSFDESHSLHGDQIAGLRVQHPMAVHGDWSETFADIRLRGMVKRDGKSVAAVVLTAKGAPPTTAFVDMKTGDVIAAEVARVDAPAMSVTFSKFRSAHGIRIPYAWEYKEEHFGTIVVKRTAFGVNQKLAPDTFAATPPAP